MEDDIQNYLHPVPHAFTERPISYRIISTFKSEKYAHNT